MGTDWPQVHAEGMRIGEYIAVALTVSMSPQSTYHEV